MRTRYLVFELVAENDDGLTRIRLELEQLAQLPRGRELLLSLERRGHLVTVRDDRSPRTRNNSGETVAYISENMRNGVGVESEVFLDFSYSPNGTHCVIGENGQWIDFPFVVNLYHELTHALHFALGLASRQRGERLTILAENELRRDLNLPARHANYPSGKMRPTQGCDGVVPESEYVSPN